MDRGSINGIRGIALPRTDPRQPRGARGGRDSLEITTPSRDVSLSLSLSRVPPTSLYASMHPFELFVFVSRIIAIIAFIYSYIYIYIYKECFPSESSILFPFRDEKLVVQACEDRNIEITGSSQQSTKPFCALSNTNSGWVDVTGRLPDFIPGYTLSLQSTIFLRPPPFLYRHLIWPAIAGGGEGAIQLEYLRLFGTLVPSTETKPGEEKGRERERERNRGKNVVGRTRTN